VLHLMTHSSPHHSHPSDLRRGFVGIAGRLTGDLSSAGTALHMTSRGTSQSTATD
jgi:hypothetical protein